MVFTINTCSSGTTTSQTKVAHESIKSSNCMVVWGIAQLDTLMKMPNKMLHPRTVGIACV